MNGTQTDWEPAVTGDGLNMYFSTTDFGSVGGNLHIFFAQRASTASPFGMPASVSAVTDPTQSEVNPNVSSDGSRLVFARPTAAFDIYLYESTCQLDGGCASTTPITELNQPGYCNLWPVMSDDGLTIFFSQFPRGNSNKEAVYVATRPNTSSKFGTPTVEPELRGGRPTWLSPDGCTIYLNAITTGSGALCGDGDGLCYSKRPPYGGD